MTRRVTAILLAAALGGGATPAFAATIDPRLKAALDQAASPTAGRALVWVFFRDKGPHPETGAAAAIARLTPRALSRRAVRAGLPAQASFEDLPLVPEYVAAVAGRVTRVRHQSRWFNAVSVEAFADQVAALAGLSFVDRLAPVGRYRSGRDESPAAASSRPSALDGSRRASDIDYGESLGQLTQINVPATHALGLHGEGVVIGIFDAGFNNLSHEVFSSMSIVARHDFVNGDDDVGDGADMGEGSHGTNTLSVIGGYKEGQLIGPAFAAHFLLAKTENTQSETPIEEDNWAAAAEWAEAQGVDVISSSLGYLDFDFGFTSYTFADMNGTVAISTRAAELAASRGVVVVNSAGNEGFDPFHNTLGAPADGVHVLTVGAVGPGGDRAPFSSVGPTADGRIKPDVAAQGIGVRVALSSTPSSYGGASGTSFSCPLTAGVVALVLQAHPTYKVDQVLTVMRATASHASAPDTLLGWGIVNALAAVQAPEPPLPTPTPAPVH